MKIDILCKSNSYFIRFDKNNIFSQLFGINILTNITFYRKLIELGYIQDDSFVNLPPQFDYYPTEQFQ